MAVDRAHGVVAGVPVGRLGGPAPQREFRVEQRVAGLAHQREMVHQDGRRHPVELLEARAGGGQPLAAPRLAGGVRLGGEQELVGGHDVALPRDGQALGLAGRALRQEAVVVEQKHRHDRGRPAALVPHREGMLRGDDAHLVAHVDQVVVARLAEDLHRIAAGGPQLVVARDPDHLGEAAPQQVKRPADLVGALGDVAGDDQPVVRRGRVQRFGDRLVAEVSGVQVGNGPQCWLGVGCAPLIDSCLATNIHPIDSRPQAAAADLVTVRV